MVLVGGGRRERANNDLSYSQQTEFRGMDEACLLAGRSRVIERWRDRRTEIVVAACSVNLLVYVGGRLVATGAAVGEVMVMIGRLVRIFEIDRPAPTPDTSKLINCR